MPLGRIYVPPPLINSGSPSPASGPSSLLSPSSNGIGDLRSKWENHQNTNSHHQQHTTNNNNGFRQIEIKVDVKKDKINKRSARTTFQREDGVQQLAPQKAETPENKSTVPNLATYDIDTIRRSTSPITNGVLDNTSTTYHTNNNDNNDNNTENTSIHLHNEVVVPPPKIIHIPIHIECSDDTNNNNNNIICDTVNSKHSTTDQKKGILEETNTCNGGDIISKKENIATELSSLSIPDNLEKMEVCIEEQLPMSNNIETTPIITNGAIITNGTTETDNTSETHPEHAVVLEKSTRRHNLPSSAKGLKNLGNTCFMNSIIQCLVHTRALLEFLQEYLATNQDKSRKITMSLARLAQDMWKGTSPFANNHGVSEPSGFRSQIVTFAPKFGGYDQHDSQEFLIYALDGLHTELNRIVKKPKNGQEVNNETTNIIAEPITYDDIEEPGISAEEKSRRCWVFYLNKDSSIITDLFLGQFRSTLRCSECQHESVTFEPFWVVSLPLSKDTNTLIDSFELFNKEETLDGDEMPTCEECKSRRKCFKRYSFEKWPEILVVHLKRFAPSGSYRAKLASIVNVPVNHLDLSLFSSRSVESTENKAVYECYGVSNHSGTLHGGHYTAACRHPYDQYKWHNYNDRSVSGTNQDHVISAEAYLLFFQKIKIVPSDEEE